MNKTIVFSGEMVDLSLPAQKISDKMQEALDRFYFGLVSVDAYSEPDTDTVEISLRRELPFDYSVAVDRSLSYIDMSIISGLAESAFMPSRQAPVISPIIPFGRCYFSPSLSFYQLYKDLNHKICGTKIRKVSVIPSTNYLTVTIKF